MAKNLKIVAEQPQHENERDEESVDETVATIAIDDEAELLEEDCFCNWRGFCKPGSSIFWLAFLWVWFLFNFVSFGVVYQIRTVTLLWVALPVLLVWYWVRTVESAVTSIQTTMVATNRLRPATTTAC